MKTYAFTVSMGYIGGSGVVIATNKRTPVELANKLIQQDKMATADSLITEADLIHVKDKTAFLITNGDY